MKKLMPLMVIVFLFIAIQIKAQTKMQPQEHKVDFPEVPRVSAYEAYIKYKAGKAIIMHAGGEAYNGRHISGAFNLEKYNDQSLLKFPKQGIEIFTYCY
jgi:hypothetical protein